MAGLLALMLSALVLVESVGIPGAALARSGTMLLMAAAALVAVRQRWGAAAFSPANVVVVLLIVVTTVALQVWARDLAWPGRAVLAILGGGLLLAAVRDDQGRVQVKMVIERLRRASFPSATATGK